MRKWGVGGGVCVNMCGIEVLLASHKKIYFPKFNVPTQDPMPGLIPYQYTAGGWWIDFFGSFLMCKMGLSIFNAMIYSDLQVLPGLTSLACDQQKENRVFLLLIFLVLTVINPFDLLPPSN